MIRRIIAALVLLGISVTVSATSAVASTTHPAVNTTLQSSASITYTTVPNVIGHNVGQAHNELTRAGLVVVNRPNSHYLVVSIGIRAGSRVLRGRRVDITARIPAPVLTTAERALGLALTKAGDPYVWAGAGPNDFDCSGLVMWAYEQLGIDLPHNTVAMLDSGMLHWTAHPIIGDLVMWGGSSPYHVEFYVRPGLTFGAHQSGEPLSYADIWGSPAYYYVS